MPRCCSLCSLSIRPTNLIGICTRPTCKAAYDTEFHRRKYKPRPYQMCSCGRRRRLASRRACWSCTRNNKQRVGRRLCITPGCGRLTNRRVNGKIKRHAYCRYCARTEVHYKPRDWDYKFCVNPNCQTLLGRHNVCDVCRSCQATGPWRKYARAKTEADRAAVVRRYALKPAPIDGPPPPPPEPKPEGQKQPGRRNPCGNGCGRMTNTYTSGVRKQHPYCNTCAHAMGIYRKGRKHAPEQS